MYGKKHIIKLKNTVGEMDTLTVECIMTGEEYDIRVDAEHMTCWFRGAKIQDAMPYLQSWERELIISGVGPRAWEEIF